MSLSKKAQARIASLINTIEVAYIMAEDTANKKVWTQSRRIATVALYKEFGIKLSAFEIALRAVEENDALGNKKEGV